ncbi:Uncharacterised protein [Bordetella trematum]|nr:transcriptional regulator [Bordetella trematum]VDH03909.1 Uncharacterised protein [Bordetella trematum]
MRNTLVDPFEDIPRGVVVTANEYVAGSSFPVHRHRRGQFAFASRGTISVATPQGRWLVPPQRACWVPAGIPHEMTMRGHVTMLNVFVSPQEVRAQRLPADCGVHGVSPLLRHLLEEAIDLPALYEFEGRAGKLMSLLLAEIAVMPRLSLHAPLPAEPRLAAACRCLFDAPSLAFGLDRMATEAGMSRRTFTRQFRKQTGGELCAMASAGVFAGGHREAERRPGHHAHRAGSGICQPERILIGIPARTRNAAKPVSAGAARSLSPALASPGAVCAGRQRAGRFVRYRKACRGNSAIQPPRSAVPCLLCVVKARRLHSGVAPAAQLGLARLE